MLRKLHIVVLILLSSVTAVSAGLWANSALRAKRNYVLLEIGEDWPVRGDYYAGIRCYGEHLFLLAGAGIDLSLQDMLDVLNTGFVAENSPIRNIDGIRNMFFEMTARAAGGPSKRYGSSRFGGLRCYVATVPLWTVPCVTVIYPFFFGVVPVCRRLYRRRHRRCEQCAYDLRGSLDAGRCPECGAGFESLALSPSKS